MKRYSKKQAEKIAIKILKRVKKEGRRPLFEKAYKNDFFTYVLDGFLALRFPNANAPALPLSDTKEAFPIDYLNGLMDNLNGYIEVEMPSLEALNAFIKAEKEKQKTANEKSGYIVYNLTSEIIINAIFLAEMLTAFPCAKCYSKNDFSPLVFKSYDGDGLICKIRKVN